MTQQDRDRIEADLLLAHRRAKAEHARTRERVQSILDSFRTLGETRQDSLHLRDGKLRDALLDEDVVLYELDTLLDAIRDRDSASRAERDLHDRLNRINGD